MKGSVCDGGERKGHCTSVLGTQRSPKILRSLTVSDGPFCRVQGLQGLSFNLVASPFPIITERGAEPNGKIYAKAVQEVLLERAHLQAGGLPTTAGPSTGGRPSPAVCPRSVSNTQAGCKRKALEEGKPTAAQLPSNKRVRGPSGDGVPAPAAHPGPAAARSSKQRGEKVLWYPPC